MLRVVFFFLHFFFSGYSSEIQDKQIPNTEALPEWNDDEERIQGPEVCDSNSRLYQAAEEQSYSGGPGFGRN